MSGLLLPTLLTACSAGQEPAPSPEATAPAAERERIVLISWDTVSAQHLALYGGGAATPNLAALAARGARWTQAITHFPETAWSHWTMMTGAEPALHGDVPRQRGSTWTGPTLAELLRARGDATGAFVGGITLEAALTGLNRGFDVYDDAGDPRREPKRDGAEVTDAALRWIAAQQGSFFAFVHYFDAHFPYTPGGTCDPGYRGGVDGGIATLHPYQGDAPPAPVLPEADLRHVVALYECEIAGLDAQLGRLLAGLPEGTRVLLVADHGESFGGGYYFNHRGSLRDEVLRVPLVVAPPPEGLVPGAEIDDQVGLSAVFSLAQGLLPSPAPVVATASDPWEGPGLLSLRAGHDKAIWKLDPGVMDRASGPPRAVYRDDVPVPGAGLPASLEGALERWSQAVLAREGQLRPLPAPGDQGPPPGALEAIGYLPRSGAADPRPGPAAGSAGSTPAPR